MKTTIENIIKTQELTIYIEQTTYVNKVDEFKKILQEFLNSTSETEYKFNFETSTGESNIRLYSTGYEGKKTVEVDFTEDLPSVEYLLKKEKVEEIIDIINKELSSAEQILI